MSGSHDGSGSSGGKKSGAEVSNKGIGTQAGYQQSTSTTATSEWEC